MAEHKIVAIGEVGLDFWVVKEEPQKEIQKEILKGIAEEAVVEAVSENTLCLYGDIANEDK